MELISKDIFKLKYSTKQLEKLYSNLRAIAISKNHYNNEQRKQTGGGTPKLKDLKGYEQKIMEMVTVAERIEEVFDSEQQDSPKKISLEALPKKQKRDKSTESRQRSSSHYPQEFIDSQIFNTTMSRIEVSHLNSLKCLSELYKMPKEPVVTKLMKTHEENIKRTQVVLFPAEENNESNVQLNETIESTQPSFNEDSHNFFL